MMKLSNTYKTFDIVTVSFPFIDNFTKTKIRPVIVLSSAANFNQTSKACIVAMITSAKNSNWPLDISITDLETAGLKKACLI